MVSTAVMTAVMTAMMTATKSVTTSVTVANVVNRYVMASHSDVMVRRDMVTFHYVVSTAMMGHATTNHSADGERYDQSNYDPDN